MKRSDIEDKAREEYHNVLSSLNELGITEDDYVKACLNDPKKVEQLQKTGRKYLPEISELIDRLGIITLKSIKLGCGNLEKKTVYEKEAREIMNDISIIMDEQKYKIEDYGMFIRAVQVGMLANETIWANESEARKEGYNDGHKLLFTHSVNGMRMRAGNVIAYLTGGRKDLNLDRVNDKISEEKGYDWNGLFFEEKE